MEPQQSPTSESDQKYLAQLQALNERLLHEIAERQKSESRYRAIVESQTEMVVRSLPDSTITFVNETVCRLFQYSAEQVIGQKWLNFLTPEDCEQIRQGLATLTPESPSFTSEQRLILAHQQERWYEWVNTGIFQEGQLVDILAVGRDITDRKRAEIALRESEERYRHLFDINPQPMWVYDCETLQFLAVNYAAIAKYGYSKEEFLSMTLLDIRPPDEIDHFLAVAKHPAQGLDHAGIWKHQLKNQQIIFVEITSYPLIFAGREAELVLAQDVTDRIKTEAALKESDRKHRTLVEALPDLIIRMTREGDYIDFFPPKNFSLFNGVKPHKGATIYDSGLPADLIPTRLHYIKQALDTQEIQIYEQHIQIDDQWFDEEIRITPVNDDEVIILIRDITDRKQAETDLYQLNQELENRIEQRTRDLRESEDRFRRIFEQSPVGIAITDLEGNIIRTNASLASMIGYSKAELSERSIQSLLISADSETMPLFDQLLEQSLSVTSFESQPCTKEGELLWVKVISALMFNIFGRPSGIIHLIENVTARKQAELEANQLRERLEFLVSSSSAVIYTCKPERDFGATFVSSNIQPLLGYTPEEFLSESNFWLSHIHPDDLPEVDAGLTQLLAKGKTAYEYRFLHQDGSYRWLRDEPKLIKDTHGKPTEIIGYLADVSDRKIAEAALQQSEARYRAVVEDQTELICRFLADGTIIFVNEAYCRYFQIQPSDAIGTSYWQFAQPECSPLQDQFQNLTQDHPTANREHQIRLANGDIRWQMWIDRAIFDESGQLIEYQSTGRDISDRKAVEQSLQEKNAELDRFFSVALDLLCIADHTGRFRRVNQQWEKTLGYTLAELENASFLDLVHPDDLEVTLQAMSKLADQEPIVNLVNRYRCQDGSYRWIEWRSFPSGDLIYAAARDISDRKTAEETLQRQLAAIEAASVGIAILENGSYTYLNQAHLTLFGYETPNELIGKSWQTLYHPAEVQRLEQEMMSILTTTGAWQGEAIATRKDGSTFIEELSLTFTNRGELICICQDITKRKQAEEELYRINERLTLTNAELDRATQTKDELLTNMSKINERLTLTNVELDRATRLKDEFLANMSHELRTPLNAVLGMSEGLQEGVFGEINEHQQAAIATIDRSGKHLLDLINDILDLSKVEAGKLEIEKTSVAIAPLCKASLSFVKHQAYKKKIHLSTEIPPHLPNIEVDERRIRQVLINLLTNAVKFTPETGEVKLIVTPEAGETPLLKFAVIDTGIGIAPEDVTKLFKPFVQVDNSLSRRHNGTGLGLALVRRLVELHQGTVTVTSELQKGSCFTVSLPYSTFVQPLTGDEASSEATVVSPANQDLLQKSLTPPSQSYALTKQLPNSPVILLAEDNEFNVATLSGYLMSRGYQMVFAKNGREALDIAQVNSPHLILMDIQMPEMDGLQAIRQLRSNPQFTDIPIIALTALAMPQDQDACLAAGANLYLTKPVKLKVLNELIQKLLTGGK